MVRLLRLARLLRLVHIARQVRELYFMAHVLTFLVQIVDLLIAYIFFAKSTCPPISKHPSWNVPHMYVWIRASREAGSRPGPTSRAAAGAGSRPGPASRAAAGARNHEIGPY